MPRSASAQFGSADFVLPPAQIARELARIAGHPYVRAPSRRRKRTDHGRIAICRHLPMGEALHGRRFLQYKPTTLRRRIVRRMVLNKMETVAAYLRRLEADPSEVEALYRDLLINVTSFFRDPETFEYLERHVIPDMLKHRQGDLPIRVWVPGCATGEEAYSIAMLLLESVQSSGGSPSIQIFASDISKQAIQVARDGFYPENIAADVSAERLRKIFRQNQRRLSSQQAGARSLYLRRSGCHQGSAILPDGSHQLPQSPHLSWRLSAKKGAGRVPICSQPRRLSFAGKLGKRGSGLAKRSARSTRSISFIPSSSQRRARSLEFGPAELAGRSGSRPQAKAHLATRSRFGQGSRPNRFVQVLSAWSSDQFLIRHSSIPRPHRSFSGAATRTSDAQSAQDGARRVGHRSAFRHPSG